MMWPAVECTFVAKCMPSLYLAAFLRPSDKDIPQPAVCLVSGYQAGGCYYHPSQSEVQLGNRFIDAERGILVMDINSEDDSLAHEWRHHWQFINGWVYDGHQWGSGADYWTNLKRYFRTSRSEMDALVFSQQRTASVHEGWLDVLQVAV